MKNFILVSMDAKGKAQIEAAEGSPPLLYKMLQDASTQMFMTTFAQTMNLKEKTDDSRGNDDGARASEKE